MTEISRIVPFAHGFTFAVCLTVTSMLVVAVTAIWEKLRDERELNELEREHRSLLRQSGDTH